MAKPVKIMETVLRDAHQSLCATRMRIEDMIPMLETLDNAGFWALEAWGGATFDSCLRFLNEDPWERLKTLKKHLPKTPISMLLRGQNILGYNHYADDVVEMFVKKMVEHGIGVIRVFDALNDVRNLETAIKAGVASGAHVQGVCVYTISPYHQTQDYVNLAKELQARGVNSICIKDMSGMIKPYVAYDLVKAIKAEVDLPVHLHTHYTSGMAAMAELKAAEAGVDIIDCALSTFANGTSQPPTESMIATFEGTEYDTGIDRQALKPVALHFASVKKRIAEEFGLNTHFDTNVNVLDFQIPGGMLSNLRKQMSEMGLESDEDYQALLDEMPIVRADAGYPPLVTPTSQIVGSMAAFNVMMKKMGGERYSMVPKEFSDLCRGLYGRTPQPVNPEYKDKILNGKEEITCRPADNIPPQLDELKKQLADAGYPNASIEDVLSYAIFPQVALEFFKNNR
ncbi:MAG: pyruvate carboxylase subunit B [Selenomonadales bacterium]|nr:pyruvate carboxylase subunit B [Selenomonadales bacterium]